MEPHDVPGLVGAVFCMKVVDLKKEDAFVEQYVALRNSYADLLLTAPVTMDATREWLRRDDIEIRALTDNDTLMGAVILYLSRDNEIAFFAREKKRGIGTELLYIIKEVAKEKGLGHIWAWVREDNLIAQKAFEKRGFSPDGVAARTFLGTVIPGVRYRKLIMEKNHEQ